MASLEVDQWNWKSMYNDMIDSFVADMLKKLNITLDDPTDPATVRIHSKAAYSRFFKVALGLDTLAVGEAYMDGDWECDDLITLIGKILRENQVARWFVFTKWFPKLLGKVALVFNTNSISKSAKDISSHYDIGNDLYQLMLDRTMNYSCGYWQKIAPIGDANARNGLCETLQEAQMNKMLLIGRKLQLKPGMRVLDIGCGWGYLAKFLAINFGVHVVAVTISKEQLAYAQTNDQEWDELEFLRVPGFGSDGKGSFEFRLQDYREVSETFDRIFSVGMFEHVGVSNYGEYFDVCRRCLKDDGIMLLHTIGIGYSHLRQVDPWLNKYIFPGGALPYHTQIINASLDKFLIEDWHNLGNDYYRTLVAWKENFDKNWPLLQDKYDERFRRMWTFYLCISAALFKKRKINLWQIVFSKKGLEGGYASCR